MVAIEEMNTRNWSPYQFLRFHIRVPGRQGAHIGLEIADSMSGYHNRHQNSASASAGDSVISVDIGANLWRGERNRPYRDNKTPINKKRIQRFSFTATDTEFYVDKIELMKSASPACPGAYAFDFGGENQPVQSGWIGLSPSTCWQEENGYGLSQGASSLGNSTPYPTLVLGDGIRMNQATLKVRLPGGPYIGWLVLERSGFWEGEQAVYTNACLFANGKPVARHSARADDAWFLLEDVETFSQDDIIDRLVLARQGTADFAFHAIPGHNTFTLSVQGSQGEVPRLAGLILAPDTDEGRTFLAGHKARQRDIIASTHRLLSGPHPPVSPSADPEAPLILAPLPTDYAMSPEDTPPANTTQPIPVLTGFAGMTVHQLVGLYAAKDLTLSASVSPLRDLTGTLPPQAIRLSGNHYLPTHGYDTTAVTIETHDYRPFEQLRLKPGLARCILLSVDIPAGTTPGTYTGVMHLAASAPPSPILDAEIKLEVVPGRLPPLDWPVGLFFSGVPIPRPLLPDDAYWRLTEELFRLLAQGGKTMLTSGPDYQWVGNGFEGDEAIRYLRLAARYGLDQKVIGYGGFDLRCDPSDPASGRAWEAFRRVNGLPEHYLNTYDEPSLPKDFPPAFDRLLKRKAAGFKTIGWTSVADPGKTDENHTRLVRESHAAAFNIHSPETLRWANQMGVEAWVYNNGLSRYSQGLHLWRNRREGARGRVDWIASIVQGFQFDALDSREPDLSCFYFHRRLGVLPAPRYLGVVEGSFDARLLSELELRAHHKPRAAWSRKVRQLFAELEARPYRTPIPWSEQAALRTRMIRLLREDQP